MLPAYAGMIRFMVGISSGFPRAPRVCGDDPFVVSSAARRSMCSPRMRG